MLPRHARTVARLLERLHTSLVGGRQAKVLERRNDNWRTLHDYILSEREQFQIVGPGGIRLDGLDREFHWFVRDGYLVRSA